MMIKVSVIVPIYNAESFLAQCLQSVMNQTLRDMEIICVNDGSTDSSPAMIEQFAAKDSRIVVINKKNSGYGHSMNLGIEAARGEYIGVVESDDFVEPEMFEELYQAAFQYDSEIVKSNFWFYWSNRGDEFRELFPYIPYEINFTPREYPEMFSGPVFLWTGIYRRNFLLSNSIAFRESPGASFQDVGFTVKVLACAKKMQLIPKAYYHYRQDNENSSMHSKGKVFCVADEFQEVWQYLSAHPETMEQVKYAVPPAQFQRLKESFGRIDDRFKWEFIARMEHDFAELNKEGFLRKEYWTKEQWDLARNFAQLYCKGLEEPKKLYWMRRGMLSLLEKFSCVYIYGAGVRGKIVCEYLQRKNISVGGFVVTGKNGAEPSFLGLPVISIKQAEFGEDMMVLIAIKAPGLYEAMRELEERGITNYIAVDDELYRGIREEQN